MGEIHRVQQGESLSGIARKRGFAWKRVWNLDENRELRERRGNPDILLPGDEIFFPDPEARRESAGDGQKHRFKVPGKRSLRVVLRDPLHEPLDGIDYAYYPQSGLEGDELAQGTTAKDGVAELSPVPPSLEAVELELPWGRVLLRLHGLDPANTSTGIQQRLHALGFDPGNLAGHVDDDTRAAIRRFQEVEGLPVTGEPDSDTIRALRDRCDGEALADQETFEDSSVDDDDEGSESETSVETSVADELDDPADEGDLFEAEPEWSRVPDGLEPVPIWEFLDGLPEDDAGDEADDVDDGGAL